MKKSILREYLLLTLLLVPLFAFSQFISVTTSHWTADSNIDLDKWLKEQVDYHQKVTLKNEFIRTSQVLYHFYTPDNSEIIFVDSFASWEDMAKSDIRTTDLVNAAWPDKAKRDAYFKTQSAYYSSMHSDEIYRSMANNKLVTNYKDSSLIYYVRKSRLGKMPEGGSAEEIQTLRKTHFDNVINKNPGILGYYSMRHFYGADSRDFIEVFVVRSMSDLEEMQMTNGKLATSFWPKEEDRTAFYKKMNSYSVNWHGDFIYRNEPKLAK